MKKPKFRNAEAAARARADKLEWEQKLKQWEAMSRPFGTKGTNQQSKRLSPVVTEMYIDPRRSTKHIASIDSGYYSTAKKVQKYTGDKILGIATLHKSNAVPVFSSEDAVEIARMRRG